jgi:hypothetical protein
VIWNSDNLKNVLILTFWNKSKTFFLSESNRHKIFFFKVVIDWFNDTGSGFNLKGPNSASDFEKVGLEGIPRPGKSDLEKMPKWRTAMLSFSNKIQKQKGTSVAAQEEIPNGN